LLATLSAAALVAGVLATAAPASAAAGDPKMLGALQTEFQSGPLPHIEKNASGTDYWADWYGKLFTNDGEVCPTGTTRSNLVAVDTATGQPLAATIASTFRANVGYGDSGDGWTQNARTSIQRLGGYASSTANAFPGNYFTAGGTFEIRHTCQTDTAYNPAVDKYFGVTIVMQPGGAWAVSKGSVEPPVKIETQTTVAAAGTTTTSTTLTATVTPAEATGTVQFKQDGVNVEAPATVTNGTASISVSTLVPATTYSFTAEYSGDTAHEASTATAHSVTTATVVDSATPDVNVTVPAAEPVVPGPSGLTISAKPGAITLTGGTRREGEVWSATGPLGAVTVKDDRRDASKGGWTLNGSSSEFVSGADKIAPSALGWTPSKASGPGELGGAAQSLATDQKLASGVASAESNVTTTVGAELELKVPATAPAGIYKAKLTLTLI
jgi:hypothetical protein